MKSNIFIPKQINVGFRDRNDTYTKKLAYVIYFDEKGKLRKEASWNSWRNKEIPNEIYENEPTSGFVLNKKAGGYDTGWNHRQTYVRVYDPRGIEFEISVENLIYILENTSSIKGKGLEGEFVYGWDGKDLVLVPTESPDYKEITSYNELLHNQIKFKGKDLKLGAIYLTKDNEEWVYLGRFNKWDYNYKDKTYDKYGNAQYKYFTKGKVYFFHRKSENKWYSGIYTITSLNKLISIVSDECVDNYAELMELLEKDYRYSPVDYSKSEYIDYTIEDFEQQFETRKRKRVFVEECKEIEIYKNDDGTYYYQVINPNYRHPYVYGISQHINNEPYYLKTEFDNTASLIKTLKPKYLREYLANGKLYREVK